jgi:hypothetical protein
MSDTVLLGLTSIGLGLYSLYLTSKYAAVSRAIKVVMKAIYEGEAEVKLVNGKHVPVKK